MVQKTPWPGLGDLFYVEHSSNIGQQALAIASVQSTGDLIDPGHTKPSTAFLVLVALV
jgi:hypothetical protein